ncbi:hypothetical protein MUO14_07705 [Halobacillus shinanisalinarum]|uniref:DUF1440 domain-containing protein n=1 Tax=Halobacillus shinanisalinarum TaxID=2932258 RepID=A0ABY4H4I2_9BACI|nr:DUF6789 family protein [Halobacillus shinanisalinarum]UOQ94805.1 hypothetical protein MUO14_07705 [Halobacillus shinanisalinarum]
MKTKRLWKGFGWGIVATFVMSIVMIIGKATGLAPMPEPIPIATVKNIFGGGPKPLLILLGIFSHFFYGGIFGALLTQLFKPVTIKKGIGLGIILWFVMQIILLPFIGWGVFGSGMTLKIAIATLILHLIYGGTLGWITDKQLTTSIS